MPLGRQRVSNGFYSVHGWPADRQLGAGWGLNNVALDEQILHEYTEEAVCGWLKRFGWLYGWWYGWWCVLWYGWGRPLFCHGYSAF